MVLKALRGLFCLVNAIQGLGPFSLLIHPPLASLQPLTRTYQLDLGTAP